VGFLVAGISDTMTNKATVALVVHGEEERGIDQGEQVMGLVGLSY
jgi:hypothetical protein